MTKKNDLLALHNCKVNGKTPQGFPVLVELLDLMKMISEYKTPLSTTSGTSSNASTPLSMENYKRI